MHKILAIPPLAGNPLSFFVYFKQNVLQYLSSISLNSESDTALKAQYLLKHPNHTDPAENAGVRGFSSVTPNDYVFIYNHVHNRNPSPIQAAVGHGIACICLSIVDKSEKVVFSFTNSQRPSLTGDLVQKALDTIQTDSGLEFHLQEEATDAAASAASSLSLTPTYGIKVEVWMRGLVNVETLANRIILSFRQSFCDFLVEQLCSPARPMAPELFESEETDKFNEDFLAPCQKLFDQAATLSSPTVSSTMATLKIPRWMREDFLVELRDIVCEVHRSLAPTVLEKPPSGRTRYTSINPVRRSGEGAEQPKRSPLYLHTQASDVSHVLVGGVDHVCLDYHLLRTTFPRGPSAPDPAILTNAVHSALGSPRDGEDHSIHTFEDNASESYRSRKSSFSHLPAPKPGSEDPWFFGETFVPGNAEGKTDLSRNCFVLIFVSGAEVSYLAYNLSKTLQDHISQLFHKMASFPLFCVE